ncbi:hypothetical protein FQA39_LY00563 [Lamprigera yunnana]|nr:hypothetical protein FQA39_LY00563 [Lamprigera yunnana]
MSKDVLISQYKREIARLTERAKNLNLTDLEIKAIYDDCFKQLDQAEVKPKSQRNVFVLVGKILLISLIITLFIYVVLNVHQPTSSIVLRNVQGLIYPGLKVVRNFAVPILKQFPVLTYLYDESCLVENPYFFVSDMECWPCQDVHTVIDLTGFKNYSLYHTGIPYITKSFQMTASFKDLRNMYESHKEMFNKDANIVKSNNSSINSLQNLFDYKPNEENGTTHISWRINRMSPAKIIRKLFPRPHIVPERAGQSVERFILIDQVKAEGYSFPNTECSYVFVIQGSGERTIILKPSRECGAICKTVSIILKPKFVLWYNWWYWRPMSFPSDNASKPSITYISSYC